MQMWSCEMRSMSWSAVRVQRDTGRGRHHSSQHMQTSIMHLLKDLNAQLTSILYAARLPRYGFDGYHKEAENKP